MPYVKTIHVYSPKGILTSDVPTHIPTRAVQSDYSVLANRFT